MKKIKNSISTREFDRKFDVNDDVVQYLDISKAKVSKHSHSPSSGIAR